MDKNRKKKRTVGREGRRKRRKKGGRRRNKYARYYRPGRRPLAFGKPRLCINIHHYAPPIGSTAQRAAARRAATSLAAARRCDVSEGSLSSFKSMT